MIAYSYPSSAPFEKNQSTWQCCSSQCPNSCNVLSPMLDSIPRDWEFRLTETMILLFWELWLSAVSELAVCCCGSLSGGPLLLLAIRPFHFMSLASPSPRKASLTPTFTYIYILALVIWCDVLKLQEASPPVVHILSPCCTFMNSCQFTSISSEKKIFVNSKT